MDRGAAKEVRETWRDAIAERVSLDYFEIVRVIKRGWKNTFIK